MFLLIHVNGIKRNKTEYNLHSTMFLLIPDAQFPSVHPNNYLHSTMFLLIQTENRDMVRQKYDLHSTMFLLIRVLIYLLNQFRKFTFHNVSINTQIATTAVK